MAHIVHDALGQLDASHCRVLELRFVRDPSYREIGDVLGITSNNAGVRINRALARLKTARPHLSDTHRAWRTRGCQQRCKNIRGSSVIESSRGGTALTHRTMSRPSLRNPTLQRRGR
jgi:hypothetical protein